MGDLVNRDINKLDGWLQMLYEHDPVRFNCLAGGIGLLIVAFSMFVAWVLT